MDIPVCLYRNVYFLSYCCQYKPTCTHNARKLYYEYFYYYFCLFVRVRCTLHVCVVFFINWTDKVWSKVYSDFRDRSRVFVARGHLLLFKMFDVRVLARTPRNDFPASRRDLHR